VATAAAGRGGEELLGIIGFAIDGRYYLRLSVIYPTIRDVIK